MSSLETSTDAVATPVTVQQLKDHLRIDGNDEDASLSAYLYAAVRWCQDYTSRQFITATFKHRCTSFANPIVVSVSPLVSVTSITYVDGNGATQTVSASVYEADTHTVPGEIRLKHNQSWPSDSRGHENEITVTYTAGYGTTGASLPDGIFVAILQLAAHWYENREPFVLGRIITPVPMTVQFLLDPYKITWVH